MQSPLYTEPEALNRLKLQRRELGGLLDVGLLAPVARDPLASPYTPLKPSIACLPKRSENGSPMPYGGISI
jgi:hypothetical protein